MLHDATRNRKNRCVAEAATSTAASALGILSNCRWWSKGSEAGRQCDIFFRRAEIVVEPVTIEQAHLARQAFNFADSSAYALAKATGEPLRFIGQDFSKTDVSP